MIQDCSGKSAEDPTKYPVNTNSTIEHECVQLIKSPDIFIIIIFVSIITIVIIIISKEVEKSLLTKE